MISLAVDASGPAASAAVARDGALVAERVLLREKAHASMLAPMARGVLEDAGVAMADVDVIACVAGPGSFTGVRIGVALAQGLAFAADKPCCAINALEALAYPYRRVSITVCPILDARAGQIYGAAFRRGGRLLDDRAMKLENFLEDVSNLEGPLLFVGDGAAVHGDAIHAALGADADASRVLRAGDAALMAFALQGMWRPASLLRPIYLRAPQAERERLQHD